MVQTFGAFTQNEDHIRNERVLIFLTLFRGNNNTYNSFSSLSVFTDAAGPCQNWQIKWCRKLPSSFPRIWTVVRSSSVLVQGDHVLSRPTCVSMCFPSRCVRSVTSILCLPHPQQSTRTVNTRSGCGAAEQQQQRRTFYGAPFPSEKQAVPRCNDVLLSFLLLEQSVE